MGLAKHQVAALWKEERNRSKFHCLPSLEKTQSKGVFARVRERQAFYGGNFNQPDSSITISFPIENGLARCYHSFHSATVYSK